MALSLTVLESLLMWQLYLIFLSGLPGSVLVYIASFAMFRPDILAHYS